MSSVKPSRRIFFLIIACIIGVSAVSFAVYASKVKSEGIKNAANVSGSNSQTTELIEKALKENGEKDDDGDGLINWEENLWSTDRSNPDTDKDGTKDGEEVKLGRNPIVAGPNDALQDGTNTETKTVAAKEVMTDKTVTGEVGRELFANYMRAKKSGATINTDLQEQIIQATFNNKTLGSEYKTYTAADVKVSAKGDLKEYGNNIGLAFYAGKTDSAVSEMDIVLAALNKNKSSDLDKLDPIITGYSKILASLKGVEVPKNLLDYHVELLNTVSRIVTDIGGLKKIISDPVVGLESVTSYSNDVEAFRFALQDLQKIFAQQEIAFDETEYGSVFMKLAQ